MKYYIEHTDFVTFYNKDDKIFDDLFNNVKLFSTFINNIENVSEEKWEKYYSKEEGRDKMIGMLYEIFGECFFKILGADNRVGVYNYKPEQIEDLGVDASGIGINNKPCTIQIKYRANFDTELTEKDLKQFGYQSQNRFNVDLNDIKNMILFTSAKGLHWKTKNKVFLNKIRTISYENIKVLVDNNHCFWNTVREYVLNTIQEKY